MSEHKPHLLLATLKSPERGKIVSAREAMRLIREWEKPTRCRRSKYLSKRPQCL